MYNPSENEQPMMRRMKSKAINAVTFTAFEEANAYLNLVFT